MERSGFQTSLTFLSLEMQPTLLGPENPETRLGTRYVAHPVLFAAPSLTYPQQAECAARNIVRLIEGQGSELESYTPPPPAIKVSLGLVSLLHD